MLKHFRASLAVLVAAAALMPAAPVYAQQGYQSERPARTRTRADDAYRPGPDQPGLGVLNGDRAAEPPPYGAQPPQAAYGAPPSAYNAPSYSPPVYGAPTSGPAAAPPAYGNGYGAPSYGSEPPGYGQGSGAPQRYQPPYGAGAPAQPYEGYRSQPGGYASSQQGFGQPYTPPPAYEEAQSRRPYMSGEGYRDTPPGEYRQGNSYSMGEITEAGHGFFGSITQGLASVIEHTHRKRGRPNGYILGEEAGGAFVAGLRYGRGRLYTKDAGVHNVYWQGPSLGFDAGAEGSKVMILVYNLRDVGDVYDRFGGIDGSAYVVGGVGVTFLNKDHVVMAPIRSGVGLRLGANVGYLKFTTQPTWNPF